MPKRDPDLLIEDRLAAMGKIERLWSAGGEVPGDSRTKSAPKGRHLKSPVRKRPERCQAFGS